jgi:hypothetical protein
VFSIGLNSGLPLYVTFTCFAASIGLTTTFVGICASRTASAASGVPGTLASTREGGVFEGILLKSSGSLSVANVQGPERLGAENHLPAVK